MTLIDSGPMIALIDSEDPHHGGCGSALERIDENDQLLTTWPCLTEAFYLLYRVQGHMAQEELWLLVDDGAIRVRQPGILEQKRCREIMRQYRELPCDIAGASLAAAAESTKSTRVFTIDGHFYAYRLNDGSHLDVFPGPVR